MSVLPDYVVFKEPGCATPHGVVLVLGIERGFAPSKRFRGLCDGSRNGPKWNEVAGSWGG